MFLTTHVTVRVCHAELKSYFLLTYFVFTRKNKQTHKPKICSRSTQMKLVHIRRL